MIMVVVVMMMSIMLSANEEAQVKIWTSKLQDLRFDLNEWLHFAGQKTLETTLLHFSMLLLVGSSETAT